MQKSAFLFAMAYQIPPIVLGLLLKVALPHPAVRAVFLLPGTVAHELLHFLVGLLLNGKPVSLSVWPRRTAPGQWVLGTVRFANLRWYNAVFIALAPLLASLLTTLAVAWRIPVPASWVPRAVDVQWWLILTPILAMCLPSTTDWRLALKSWPLLLLALAGAMGFAFRQALALTWTPVF
jgi:hypothetical protein